MNIKLFEVITQTWGDIIWSHAMPVITAIWGKRKWNLGFRSICTCRIFCCFANIWAHRHFYTLFKSFELCAHQIIEIENQIAVALHDHGCSSGFAMTSPIAPVFFVCFLVIYSGIIIFIQGPMAFNNSGLSALACFLYYCINIFGNIFLSTNGFFGKYTGFF